MFFMIAGPAGAYVPQAPHLLHLVVQKIKQPVGIEARQIKTVLYQQGSEARSNDIDEKLIYLYPNKLRSQILSGDRTGFAVESDFRFIRVTNGRVVSHEKSVVDRYTDVLLYRDHKTLLQQLESAGINTRTVSFQRYDGTICYLIGVRDTGLWIDKETFLPVRYMVKKNNLTFEFVYKDWQPLGKTWYPMAGSIYLDSQLLATVRVKNIDFSSQVSSDLFDVKKIQLMYPGNQADISAQKKQEKELDKGLENLKKLYE